MGPRSPPGSRLRKPSLKRAAAPPTSGAARISRVCGGKGEDVSRRKKVKFADSATFHELSCNQETASLRAQGTSTCNEAKTSEYKFLQKLREETACKLYSCLPKQSCNTTAFETRRNMKELNDSIRSNYETRCSVFPIQNVTPVAQRCSLSPAKVSQNSGVSILPIQNITPMSGRCSLPIPDVPWNADYENGGLFTKKREKILRLAAETLSLKLDDFVSNRSGLIATLLERLRAGQSSSSLDELPGPEPEKPSGIVYFLGSSKSDGNYTARTENSEITARKHLETGILSCRCRRPHDLITLPMDYIEGWGSATRYATEADPLHEKCNWLLEDGSISSLPVETESASDTGWDTGFRFQNHGCNKIDHLLPESDYFSNDNFHSCFHVTEKSLVPFEDSTSLLPAKDGSSIQLWIENAEDGQHLSVASDSAVAWEVDRLPLTLYSAPAPAPAPGGFLDRLKGYQFTDCHEKRILDSPPASCNMIMARDACHQSLDRHLSTAGPALELEWKSSPIHTDWQNCLSLHTDNQFHEKIKSSLNCNNLMPLDESHRHYNSPSMLQDEYHFDLDRCLSTSRLDSEWSLRTGSDWQYPNLQFSKKKKGMLNYVYGGNRYNNYIGEQSLLKFQGQSASCLIDFSSPGLRFSLGSERNFSPIPDGLSWQPGID